MRACALLFAVVVFLAAPFCLADMAPNPLLTGGTNLALRGEAKTTPVTMLWEEVDLRPSVAQNAVKAVFLLKNPSELPVELEVGFPSYFQMPLQDFTVEVDGSKSAGEVKKDGPAGPKKMFTYWMCWPMKFAPGQEHKVTVSYWVAPEMAKFVRRPATGKDRAATMNEPVILAGNLPEDLRDQVGARESGYVLRTGAGWAGTIGKATIRLHYGPGFAKESVAWMQPEKMWKFNEAEKVDTLMLENLKPTATDDISYSWRVGTVENDKKLVMTALKAGKLSPPALKDLLIYLGWTFYAVKSKPTAEQLEVLTSLVAPVGPGFDPSQLADITSYMFYHKVYQQVWQFYRDGGQTDKAVPTAQAFQSFLQGLAKVKQAEAEKSQAEADKKILSKQTEDVQKELAELDEFLKNNPAASTAKQ